MNLSLYDKDLNRISVIGSQFVSCLWNEGYNSVGSFSLELIETPDYKKKVRQDFYIGRADRKTVMVIKSVEFRNGRIIASGKQATRILDDVAMLETIKSGANIDEAVYSAYNRSNKYRGLRFESTNLGIKSTNQVSNKSFLKVCETLCEDAEIGFKVERSGSELVAKFYKPDVNENLIFAEKFGNLSDPSVTLSSENYKNYVVVFGQGSGDKRISVVVDATNGSDRRELVVDARDVQMEENESEEHYRNRLTERAVEKLLEHQEVFSCLFTPKTSDFGKRYDLGDVMMVHLDGYGLKLQARVSQFTQKSQNNKTETNIEVGKITIKR